MQFLFDRFKKKETRKERDFRIWINSEETIKALDLCAEETIRNYEVYLDENYEFLEFMILYQVMRGEFIESSLSKGKYKKIKKAIKIRIGEQAQEYFDMFELEQGKPILKYKEIRHIEMMMKIFYKKEFKELLQQLAENVKKDANNYQKDYIDKTLNDMNLYLLVNS